MTGWEKGPENRVHTDSFRI